MNNNNLRSEIKSRFEQIDDTLSSKKMLFRTLMGGCAVIALCHTIKMLDSGVNAVDFMNASAFGAFSATAYFAYENLRKGKQNIELGLMLLEQNKHIPNQFFENNQTARTVATILKCTILCGIVAGLSGKLDSANFNFLIGNAGCACMVYGHYLNKNSRKIIGAEFPKGVVDERVR